MFREAAEITSEDLTSISFQATPIAVRGALARARTVWQSKGIAQEVCETGEQVLAEVLNNVVEHAQADRPDGVVQLETTRRQDGITCIVRDDGAAMPDLQLPAGRLADIGECLESLPEGGFGWFMIRELTEDLRYDRKDGWNLLQFNIASGGTPG